MRFSLKRSIAIVSLILSLLPAYIVGSVMISKNSQRETEQQKIAVENATQAISDRIQQQLKFTTNLSSWYASNRSITRTVDNIYFSTVVWEMMNKFTTLAGGVSSIYLINDEWQPVYDSQGSIYHLEQSLLLNQIKQYTSSYQQGKTVHTAYFEQNIAGKSQQGIAMVTPLLPYRLLEGSKYTPTGYILVLISFESLQEMVKPLLLDGEGVEFVYGNAPMHQAGEDITKVLAVNDPLFSRELNLWFVQHVSDHERMKQVEQSEQILLQVLLFVLFITLAFVFWFNRIFSKQIAGLERIVDAYMHDQLPTRSNRSQLFTEFYTFSNLLTKMWSNINKHLDELTIKNIELSEANEKVQAAKQELEVFNESLEQQVEEKTSNLTLALDREAEQRAQLLKIIEFISKKYEGAFLEIADMIDVQLAHLFPQTHAYFTLDSQSSEGIAIVTSNGVSAGRIIFNDESALSDDQSLVLNIYIKQLAAWMELQLNLRSDAQTECLNRKAFEEDFTVLIKRISEQHQHISLHIIDLNGLKPVNDTLGHDAGDYLIGESVITISSALGRNSACYRIGGDEFALISYNFDESHAAALTQQLRDLCDRRGSLTFANQTIPFSFAVGYASTENTDVSELFSIADQNMYKQKKAHYKATGLSRESGTIK